jgi:methylated-DNA-[protein]-cysteine S-methyltransferase
MNKKEREPTAFESSVYNATRKIPKGKVTTYKHLAKAIGCGSSQAIGQALKGNPFAPEVPCHRVIKSDLTIGGFAGHTDGPEIRRKKRLLKSEGVSFAGNQLVDSKRVFTY